MITISPLVANSGYVWGVSKDAVACGQLAVTVTESGLGTLKIATDSHLDTPSLRRALEQLVVQVFEAQLCRKLQVVATVQAEVVAIEKSGFALTARQPAVGARFAATKSSVAEAMALATMARHIDLAVWGFRFDNGKRRAGQCNYTERVISISNHLVAHHNFDEIQQVVLHEIAHAMVGSEAGHGPVFKKQAAALGYRGKSFTGREIAANEAPWVGSCAAGHTHYRYRKPTRPLGCALCSKTFSRATQIVWRRSEAS